MSSQEFKIKTNLEITRQILPPKEERKQKFENAQAYKRARDCLYLGTKIGNQISKQFKGSVAKDYTRNLYKQILNIALAYNAIEKDEKLEYLDLAIKHNTEALIILRLAYDLNGVKRDDYTSSVALLVDLSIQLKTWRTAILTPPPLEEAQGEIVDITAKVDTPTENIPF